MVAARHANAMRTAASTGEVLAVIAVLIVVTLVMADRAMSPTVSTKKEVDRQNQELIHRAVERWTREKGQPPARDLSDIGNDPEYFPHGVPVSPLTGKPYQLDANYQVP